jgi:hypothetical protein
MAKSANSELTDREWLFIDHYIVTLNGTQSAEQAGFEGDYNVLAVTAHNLLKKPKIKREIAKRLKDHAMSSYEVLRRYSDMGQANLGDFADVKTFADLKKHPKSFLVKKLEFDGGFISKIELHDAKSALDSLAKYHSLAVDKVEVSMDDKLLEVLKEVRKLND